MRDLYIDVSHEVLEDLKVRLRGARFPVVLDEQENSAGISVEFEKSRGLLAYRVRLGGASENIELVSAWHLYNTGQRAACSS